MSYWSSASLSRPIFTPCLTNCGKYSAYLVAMSACVASSPSASKRSASSSSRAVTYEYAGSFSISVRAASTTHLRTSSIGTPS